MKALTLRLGAMHLKLIMVEAITMVLMSLMVMMLKVHDDDDDDYGNTPDGEDGDEDKEQYSLGINSYSQAHLQYWKWSHVNSRPIAADS